MFDFQAMVESRTIVLQEHVFSEVSLDMPTSRKDTFYTRSVNWISEYNLCGR
jgi:hypothetical protein